MKTNLYKLVIFIGLFLINYNFGMENLENEKIEWFKKLTGMKENFKIVNNSNLYDILDYYYKPIRKQLGDEKFNEELNNDESVSNIYVNRLFNAAKSINILGGIPNFIPSNYINIAIDINKKVEEVSKDKKEIRVLLLGASSGGFCELSVIAQLKKDLKIKVYYNDSHDVDFENFKKNVNDSMKRLGIKSNIEFESIVGDFTDKNIIDKFKIEKNKNGSFDIVLASNCLYFHKENLPKNLDEYLNLIDSKKGIFIATSVSNFNFNNQPIKYNDSIKVKKIIQENIIFDNSIRYLNIINLKIKNDNTYREELIKSFNIQKKEKNNEYFELAYFNNESLDDSRELNTRTLSLRDLKNKEGTNFEDKSIEILRFNNFEYKFDETNRIELIKKSTINSAKFISDNDCNRYSDIYVIHEGLKNLNEKEQNLFFNKLKNQEIKSQGVEITNNYLYNLTGGNVFYIKKLE